MQERGGEPVAQPGEALNRFAGEHQPQVAVPG
jgi:hypothetical protein